MSMARTIRMMAVCAVSATTGCVDRKFVVESNVPNAQVYVDNAAIGAAPAYASFEYYGYYTIRVVYPGYDTVVKRQHIAAPWYAYPPLDFITEVLLPFHIRDTRRIHIELQPAAQGRTDDILNAAEALRQRGAMLPLPDRPAPPRVQPNQPAPGPTIGPPVEPAPGVLPSPLPGPGTGPIPAPTPVPTPAPGVAPGVVPRVTPN